jgi:hypothetical protein
LFLVFETGALEIVWVNAFCVVEGGMRHTSVALYFYGVSKESLHKPRANFGNILFQINYSLNYYLQLLCLLFYSELPNIFKKFTFGIKTALFLKYSLYHSGIVKIVHLQNKTSTYYHILIRWTLFFRYISQYNCYF